jgi:hypothetical protein
MYMAGICVYASLILAEKEIGTLLTKNQLVVRLEKNEWNMHSVK